MQWWNDILSYLTKSNTSGTFGRSVNVNIVESPESGLAKEETQLEVLEAVQNIKIDAEYINLNTDDIESLIETSNSKLNSLENESISANEKLNTVNSSIEETNDILNDQTIQLNNIDQQTDGIKAATESIDSKIPANLTMSGDSLKVYVSNQIDLTTITSYLLAIKNSVAAIDLNTDNVETLISNTITAINSNGTVNHADLVNILNQVTAINANTDTEEALLTNILNKIIAAPATEAKQDIGNTSLNNIDSNIGAKADVAASSDTGTFSVIAFIKRGLQYWSARLGQKTMTDSLSATCASDQPPIPVKLRDYQTDGSGRLRVSMIYALGDYRVLNSVFDTKLWEQVGTATFTVNTNNILISVTSGQYGIIQSKMYHPYLNGKSQLVQLTVYNMGSSSNSEKSFGYFSSIATGVYDTGLDGIRLYKSTANVYSWQIWRNGTQLTTTSLNRANWFDKLDGTGISGMTINFDNFNVFTFDFLYLGGTALACYVNYNKENILFAVYYYSNTDTQPFLLSPNKPIRYEIRSTTGTGSLGVVCATVGTEGQLNGLGGSTSVEGAMAGVTPLAAGVKYAIAGVRKAATQRDIYAIVESFEGIISTNDFINWQIVLNPTVAGTFTYSAVTGTPLEQAVGGIGNTVTGGFILSNTYSSLNMNNAKVTENILARLNSTINNTMDTIVLCATPSLGSNNVKVTGSMQVRYIN